MSTIDHKRGDRFSKRCTWRDSAGSPVVLASSPRSQLRNAADVLVQELTISLEPQSGATIGVFYLSATAAETALWPLASLDCDVQRADTEESSQTFKVRVLPDVTR